MLPGSLVHLFTRSLSVGRISSAVLRKRFVSGLRGFGQAVEMADKVTPKELAQELAQDEHFEEIAASAKRMLPYLQAVANSAGSAKAKPAKKTDLGKGKVKASTRRRSA